MKKALVLTICLILINTVLFHGYAEAESLSDEEGYSISHSYGSMAPTRIRELLRHDECFYAIVDEPQGLFGNHVVHKVKEIDLATGKEETLYSNASRRIYGLMATDEGLYFLEPNLYHNNNTAYRIDLKSKKKTRQIGQEYSPWDLLGVNERGLYAACVGDEGTEIWCFKDDEAECIVTRARLVRTVSDNQVQFGLEGEDQRMSYSMKSGEMTRTQWPATHDVFYECGSKAICRVFDKERDIYPIGYTIADRMNNESLYHIQPEAFEEYTFALLEDVLLLASKEKGEEHFTIRSIDMATGDCLDEERLTLTSPLFMIGNQVFYEIETDVERKIIEHVRKRVDQ